VHIALYRITQEALNNVIKPARAHQVTVRLGYTVEGQAVPMQTAGDERPSESGLSVLLSIRDDGRGFDPSKIPHNRLGLGIMQERFQAISATLTIETSRGTAPK
jgi:signal transduction histidine kinase